MGANYVQRSSVSRGGNSGYRPQKAFCAHVRVECANHDFWLYGFLVRCYNLSWFSVSKL